MLALYSLLTNPLLLIAIAFLGGVSQNSLLSDRSVQRWY